VTMRLLKPGTGNQKANRSKAVKFIVERIIDASDFDLDSGVVTAKDGTRYQVSAYAETGAAFVSTPGLDKSKYSIYASGVTALMYRQLRNDQRSFVYEVEPDDVEVAPGSTSAEWTAVDAAAKRIWVCSGDKIRLIEKSASRPKAET